MCKLYLLLSLTLGITFFPQIAQADPADPYVVLLEKYGIKPNVKSIGGYLIALHPDKDTRKRHRDLIEQLGDDDFFRRESAMHELLRSPAIPVDLLQEALQGNNPEIRWRIETVQRQADGRLAQILHAALSVIRLRELKGLARPVLASVLLCEKKYMELAAQKAMVTTTVPGDQKFLKRALKSRYLKIRIIALIALEKILGAQADTDLLRLTKDSAESVQLTAARALVNHGNRQGLATLVRLLDSNSLEIRMQSIKVLRTVSRKNFGYTAYNTSRSRVGARNNWQRWLTGPGKIAKLNFPLDARRQLLGRTLIFAYSANRVIELDSAGNTIWSTKVNRPWGGQGLPNGHRLVASYADKSIIEFDNSGKEVWRKMGLPGPPYNVRRLENGNTLVACSSGKKVLEIRPDKSIANEITFSGRPTTARRLENGNTLVCLQTGKRVVEVDSQGKVIWQLTDLPGPFSAQRLENGNTLVACSSSTTIVEYDPIGRPVWRQDGFRSPWDAQRLDNGNTLIVDRSGLTEVNRNGDIVWKKKMSGVMGVHRY